MSLEGKDLRLKGNAILFSCVPLKKIAAVSFVLMAALAPFTQAVSTLDADFSVIATPSAQTVAAGSSTTHAITITALSGNPAITLSLDLPPSIGVYSFTPSSGTPTFTSKLTITTLNTVPPGTYNLNISVTSTYGIVKNASLTLVVAPAPTLTLNLNPQPVARGAQLTIGGQLTVYTSPVQAGTIRLYCRYPHSTGTWNLAATFPTNVAGAYNVVATVPNSLPPGNYDLVAVWFNEATGNYAASPVTLFTVT